MVDTPSPNDYTVGWICAVEKERVAAQAFLDEEYGELDEQPAKDDNSYLLGRVGKHRVVIAVLPHWEYGLVNAANVAKDLVRSFPNVRIGLMVGIGGGVPTKHDIRLGDVVVSSTVYEKGAVIQYDFGKTVQNQGFIATGFLNKPPTFLMTAVNDLKARYKLKGNQLEQTIRKVLDEYPRIREEYKRPDAITDRLYKSNIIHTATEHESCITTCGDDDSVLVTRAERLATEDNPAIHYGLIASANQLMKDAVVRDNLAAEKDVLCFEMEAAGLVNHFPCIVIRGICDYSDTHKNDEWQGYAAMTAAAYAKDLLSRIPPSKVEAEKKLVDVLSVAKDVKDIKHMVQKDVDNHRLDKVIARLPFAKGATFDSSDEGINPRCHIKTRIELRHQIQSWAEDQQVKCFFWLKGMAGTGKSTISRTMADWLSKENKLGASFFFKRGEADRDSSAKLFTTICAQLLINIPALISPVELAIDTDPYISEKSMGEQFEKLICQPLSQIQNASKLILLFDALDECTQGETFLRLLSQTKDKWSPNLQIMITSRPEKAIRLGFKDVEEEIRKDIELYDMPRPIVERDITFFLEDEFAKIRKKYEKDGQKLPLTWPGKEILRDLVSMAVPLFIVAATICRFIEDEVWSDPAGQLKKVLDYHNRDPDTDSHIERLDATYSPILNQLIVGRTKKAQKPLIDRFRKIVGPIIHLAEPLSRSSLASLLDIDSQQIESQLSSLHSVFSVPSSAESPIRMLHLSFRDFLVDADRSETDLFWINEKETHHMIVIKCLDRMSRYEHFRDNICGLEHYGILRSDIERGLIDKCLPADLQYASIFWVSHFEQSEMGISDNDIIHGFLKTNFLHWLEALSLLGRISESIDLIHRLRSIVKDKNSEVYRFLEDATRFLRKNRYLIDYAPLQLYVSALVFTPLKSIIRILYIEKIPSWIRKLPAVELTWGALIQTLEDHSGGVNAVAFSHDGKLVVSGSDDETVKLWDSATGALRQTLTGHSAQVNSVAFAPNGKLIVSGSCYDDHTVKLWDPATGILQQTLRGHSKSVNAVAFSPDSKLVVSGSNDWTIKFWNAATSALQHTIVDHSGSASAVTYSGDGKVVASGSDDHTIKFWDTSTGALQQVLEGHSGTVTNAMFSSNGKLLVSGSYDGDQTVKLWNTATGTLQQTIKANSGSINAMALSPDGELVAVGFSDHTIKLWDTATGTLQQIIEGHAGWVVALAFSRDGKLLASGSADQKIKLWDPYTSVAQKTPKGYSDWVSILAFSPNGKLLASGSRDRKIKLWDPYNDTVQRTLEGHSRSLKGHSGYISALGFSPDGKLLASGSVYCFQTVKLWDTATGTLQWAQEDHADWISALAFSPDGRLLASGSSFGDGGSDQKVKLWDTATGTLQRTLTDDFDWISALAFSPDGRLLASGSSSSDGESDQKFKLWDATTGTLIRTFERYPGWISALVFSSDGKKLASGSNSRLSQTVKLWDVASGILQQNFESYSGGANAVTLSSDGNFLITDQGCFEIDSLFNENSSPTVHKNILDDNAWVTRNGTKMIWLPDDYRASCSTSYKNMLVLGHAMGGVTFLQLD